MDRYRRFDDEKRRRRALPAWCCCCIALLPLIALITVAIVVPLTVSNVPHTSTFSVITSTSTTGTTSVTSATPTSTTTGTTSTTPTTTPEPLCSCEEEPSQLYSFSFDSNDGRCLAYNSDDGQMYYWTGYPAGSHTFTTFNETGPGENLLNATTLPIPIDGVLGCVYYPPTGMFIVSDYNNDLYSMDVTGSTGSLIGSTGISGTLKGFALVNGTRLFGAVVNNGQVYELDPTTGAVISGPLQALEDITYTSSRVFGIDWDAQSEETYVLYRKAGVTTQQHSLGRIDLTTGYISETCINTTLAWAAMEFDAQGRLWMVTGEVGPNERTLFLLSDAPCFTATPTPAMFNINCPPMYTGALEENLQDIEAGVATVTGTGCGGKLNFNLSFVNSSPIVSFAKRRISKSKGNQKVSRTTMEEVPMTAVVIDMENVTPEHFTNITEKEEKRDLLFPTPGVFDQSLSSSFGVSGAAAKQSFMYAVNTNMTQQVQQSAIGYQIVVNPFMTLGAAAQFFVNNLFSQGPCSVFGFDGEVLIKYDTEADRWVLPFISQDKSQLCLAISTTPDAMGSFNSFIIPLDTPALSGFEFSIWGDHYIWCQEGACHLLNRNGFLSMTPQNMCTVWNTTGLPVPLEQGINDRNVGSAFTLAPCGLMYRAVSTDQKIEQLTCTSIDYTTCMVAETFSETLYDPWSTAVGSCNASDACIPTAFDFKDPIRDAMAVGYFGDTVAWAFSFGANGVDRSKIRWQMGALDASGPPAGYNTIDDGPGTHLWNPKIVIDPLETLLISYYMTTPSPNLPWRGYAYRLKTSPPGQLTNTARIDPSNILYTQQIPVYSTIPRHVTTSVLTNRKFILSYLPDPNSADSFFGINRLVTLAPQQLVRTWTAQDTECLGTDQCTQIIRLE